MVVYFVEYTVVLGVLYSARLKICLKVRKQMLVVTSCPQNGLRCSVSMSFLAYKIPIYPTPKEFLGWQVWGSLACEPRQALYGPFLLCFTQMGLENASMDSVLITSVTVH